MVSCPVSDHDHSTPPQGGGGAGGDSVQNGLHATVVLKTIGWGGVGLANAAAHIPEYVLILTIGTLQKGPLILGNPYVLSCEHQV